MKFGNEGKNRYLCGYCRIESTSDTCLILRQAQDDGMRREMISFPFIPFMFLRSKISRPSNPLNPVQKIPFIPSKIQRMITRRRSTD